MKGNWILKENCLKGQKGLQVRSPRSQSKNFHRSFCLEDTFLLTRRLISERKHGNRNHTRLEGASKMKRDRRNREGGRSQLTSISKF